MYFIVHEKTTETVQPETRDSNTSTDGNSAAVVVVPIVIVLLCLIAGVVAYLYWRRLVKQLVPSLIKSNVAHVINTCYKMFLHEKNLLTCYCLLECNLKLRVILNFFSSNSCINHLCQNELPHLSI